jgi:hypothetical protein
MAKKRSIFISQRSAPMRSAQGPGSAATDCIAGAVGLLHELQSVQVDDKQPVRADDAEPIMCAASYFSTRLNANGDLASCSQSTSSLTGAGIAAAGGV